jgi:hypothetical protein
MPSSKPPVTPGSVSTFWNNAVGRHLLRLQTKMRDLSYQRLEQIKHYGAKRQRCFRVARLPMLPRKAQIILLGKIWPLLLKGVKEGRSLCQHLNYLKLT